jgi:broad specificity phosphatase PhoE
MELVLLTRHAESAASVAGLTNGDPRRPIGLTALGRAQARRLGEQLADVQIELCAVSEFRRAQETADLALAGRDIPRLVLAGLNDIRFGEFEGQPLSDYRRWARAHGPEDVVPGGGDSRAATVGRYAEAFRTLLVRPEETIFVVAHSLPVRYALDAAAGTLPGPAVEQIPYAEPFELDSDQLNRAVDLLERWARAPIWR